MHQRFPHQTLRCSLLYPCVALAAGAWGIACENPKCAPTVKPGQVLMQRRTAARFTCHREWFTLRPLRCVPDPHEVLLGGAAADGTAPPLRGCRRRRRRRRRRGQSQRHVDEALGNVGRLCDRLPLEASYRPSRSATASSWPLTASRRSPEGPTSDPHQPHGGHTWLAPGGVRSRTLPGPDKVGGHVAQSQREPQREVHAMVYAPAPKRWLADGAHEGNCDTVTRGARAPPPFGGPVHHARLWRGRRAGRGRSDVVPGKFGCPCWQEPAPAPAADGEGCGARVWRSP